MTVTFKGWGERAASGRYRALIPQIELHALGVERGTDWLVIGKHGWNLPTEAKGFKRICFDICDDHFNGPHDEHYRYVCQVADRVTCNSAEMGRIIARETGRDAIVIPDPYEQPERVPRIHDSLLWFGHQSNLPDLMPWVHLPKLEIVTGLNLEHVTPWSPAAMDVAFNRAGLVIIPTGKSMAKSANRAVESIRRGLFVVAGPLPAYETLGIYLGDIGRGIEWALANKGEVIEKIKTAQKQVAVEYAPERIGRLWKEALGV